jgi:hypothetical protein
MVKTENQCKNNCVSSRLIEKGGKYSDYAIDRKG